MNLLSSLAQLGLALGILGVSSATGLRLLGWIGYRPDHPVERLCLAAAMGAGTVATALLLLGLSGVLSGLTSWGVVIAAATLARRELRELPSLVRRVGGALREAGLPALATFGGMLLITAVLAGAPVTNWDSLAYHLPVPTGWLDAGAIRLPTSNLHAAYVGLQHMLYLPALALGADRAPALLSASFAGLLGLAAFATCRRLSGKRAASLALPLVFTSPVLLLVAMTPRVDTTLVFYLLLGHLLVLIAWETRSRGALLSACLVLGLSVGVKPLGLLYGAVLSPLILWVVVRDWRDRSGEAVGPGRHGWVLVAGIAAAVPWLVKNQVLFGSPLYPYLGDRIVDPWLRPLLGTVNVPASVPAEVFDLNRYFRIPFNLRDFFLDPGKISDEIEAGLYFPSPLLLLLPLLLWRRRAPLLLLVLPALAFGVGVYLLLSGLVNVRYLIPALVPLTMAAVILLADVLPPVGRWKRAALGTIAGLALLPAGYSLATQAMLYPLGAYYSSNTMGPVDYLRASGLSFEASHGELVAYTNRHVPDDAQILLLFDSRRYYFDARVIGGSNIHSSWPLLAATGPRPPCPDEFGASHVIVYRSLARALAEARVPEEVLRWNRFGEYRKRCLTLLHRTESHTLYRTAVDGSGTTPFDGIGPPPEDTSPPAPGRG